MFDVVQFCTPTSHMLFSVFFEDLGYLTLSETSHARKNPANH